MLIKTILGLIENRLKLSLVIGLLNEEFAVLAGLNAYLYALAYVQAIRRFLKRILSFHVLRSVVPAYIHVALENEHSSLVLGTENFVLLPFCKLFYPNVHVHLGVFAVHFAENLFIFLVECRIFKHI